MIITVKPYRSMHLSTVECEITNVTLRPDFLTASCAQGALEQVSPQLSAPVSMFNVEVKGCSPRGCVCGDCWLYHLYSRVEAETPNPYLLSEQINEHCRDDSLMK